MTEPPETQLPGGFPATVLTRTQVNTLVEMIEERQWWHGAKKRLKTAGGWGAWVSVGMTGFILWWPYLKRMVDAFIESTPPGMG